MPDPKLLFILDAKNLASKEFAKAKTDLKGVETAAVQSGGGIKGWAGALGGSRLAMLGAGAAIGGLVLGMKAAAEAAIEEEKNVARLDAALRSNVEGWKGNTDAIEAQIAERERLAFSDDELRASLGTLVAATKDVTKAQALQATAMDLARLKGISLEEASTALIKVEGGQYRMLKQLGIQLPKTASATEALAAVQKAAGGQAEAYANTTAGVLESTGNIIGDLVEDFGSMLLPIIKDFALFIRDEVVPAIKTVADIFTGLIDIVGDAGVAIKGFADDVAGAVADLEVDGVRVGDAWDVLLDRVGTAWGEVSGIAEAQANEVTTSVESMKSEIDWDGIAAALPDALEESKEESKKIARATPFEIAKSLREGSNPVKLAADLLKDAIKNSLTPMKEIAALEAELTGADLAKRLNSKRPEVRAAAEAYKLAIEDRLFALRNNVPSYALATGQEYAEALASKREAVRQTALQINKAVRIPLTDMPAHTWGGDMVDEFAQGVKDATNKAINAAIQLSNKVADILEFGSPTKEGPFSEKGGPRGWAEIGASDFVAPWANAASRLEEIFEGMDIVPSGAGLSSPGAVPASFGAPVVVHSHLYLDGRQIYESVEEQRYYAQAAAPR